MISWNENPFPQSYNRGNDRSFPKRRKISRTVTKRKWHKFDTAENKRPVIIFWNFTTFEHLNTDLTHHEQKKLNIYWNKLHVRDALLVVKLRVASSVAEYEENLTTGLRHSLVSSLPSRNETLAKRFKADTKVFWSCPMLLDSFTLFQLFCPAWNWFENICLT